MISYITFICSHFPLLYRIVNATERIVQSIPIAIHTPITPRLSTSPNRIAEPNRKISMEQIPTIIVNRTSPTTRKLFARLNEVR